MERKIEIRLKRRNKQIRKQSVKLINKKALTILSEVENREKKELCQLEKKIEQLIVIHENKIAEIGSQFYKINFSITGNLDQEEGLVIKNIVDRICMKIKLINYVKLDILEKQIAG